MTLNSTFQRRGFNRNLTQNGPAKGKPLYRWSTRLARVYGRMVRSSRLCAIPLESRALAAQLGCSYETLIRITRRFADAPWWLMRAYGVVVFERHRRHKTAKCGHPQYYIINKNAIHRIGGEAGKVRAHLRAKEPAAWIRYLDKLKNLKLAVIFKRKNAANDQHHGVAPLEKQEGAEKARPPPPENRAACRRIIKMAGSLAAWYDHLGAAPAIKVFPWIVNRLREEHSFVRVQDCLKHAVRVAPRGRYAPPNLPAWILAVAGRHLEDGLAPIQRKHAAMESSRWKARADARALKEACAARAREVKPRYCDVYGQPCGRDAAAWIHVSGTHWKPI